MNTLKTLGMVVLLGATMMSPRPAIADGSPFVPQEAIVQLRAGFTIEQFNARYMTATAGDVPARRVYLVTLPSGQSEQSFVDAVRLDPDVVAADVNYFAEDVNPEGSTQSIFLSLNELAYQNDSSFSIVAPGGAQTISTGAGVTVAVVDSGVDAAHPRLAGRIAPGGFDFIDNDPDPMDSEDGLDNNDNGAIDEFVGHGTLAAGLIARVAPGALILPVRVLGTDGESTTFGLARGIFHALDHGADVINVSLGVAADPFMLRAAAEEALARGVMIVASAGNDDRSDPARSPAFLSALGVVGVAATDAAGVRAPFSNFGSWVALSAPGMSVVSLTPGGGYGSASGTSFAAPIVSGTAARVRALCPATSLTQWRAAMSLSAANIHPANPSFVGQLGAGLVNAAAAVVLAASNCLPACNGDYDRNGVRSFNDITQVLLHWGSIYNPGTIGPGDGDGDLLVDFNDITVVLLNFGDVCA